MGWAEEYKQDQDEQHRKLRLRVAADLDYDPERAARVFGVKAKTNLPSEVVDADLEGLETQLKRNSFDYDRYTDEKNGSPIFNQFASEDPYNYAVLNRDYKSMNGLEKLGTQISLGWESGFATTRLADMQNRRIGGDKRESDEQEMKELRDLLSGDSFGADAWWAKTLVFTAQQLPIMGTQLARSTDEALAGAIGGGLAALAGGQMGPQALAPEELLTVPGAAIGGASVGFVYGRTKEAALMERGLAYDQYLELGINEKDALTMANMVGSVNGVAESLGLGALVKRVPGFDKITGSATDKVVGQIFNQPTFKNNIAKLAIGYGEGMATEIVTEVIQESSLMAGQEYLKSQERARGNDDPMMQPMTEDEFWGALKETAIHTMYGTALIGSSGPLMQYRRDSRKVRNAQEQAHKISHVAELAEDSVSKGDDSGVWEAFVKRLTKDGPVKEVRVKVEGWRKYWQSKQIDPDDAAAELGLDLNEQEINDVDLVIPFDVYVDKVAATEHHAGLSPDMRFNQDDMTQREAEEWIKSAPEEIKRIEESIGATVDRSTQQEIIDDLTGQLINAGYNESAAKTMAELHSLIVVNKAGQVDMDPMDLYKGTLQGVVGEVPEALAGKDVDMDMDPLLDRLRNQDFPRQRDIFSGGTLIDLIRGQGGIQDEGGELSARDFGKQFPGVISKAGKSFDAIAEVASEEGFLAAYDQDQLMEAIESELAGTQVFSRRATMNQDLDKLRSLMEQAQSFLNEEGIDLSTMSNAEVRKRINGMKTLNQSSKTDMDDWTDLLLFVAMKEEQIAMDNKGTLQERYGDTGSLLAAAEAMMPRVADEQDFSGIKYEEPFVDSKGKTGTATINADKAYKRAVKKRNSLKQLLDCVNG